MARTARLLRGRPCPLPAYQDAPGMWLDAAEAEAELRDRHWWPLAAHATHANRKADHTLSTQVRRTQTSASAADSVRCGDACTESARIQHASV